jgi:hypothetical protein
VVVGGVGRVVLGGVVMFIWVGMGGVTGAELSLDVEEAEREGADAN